MKVLAYGFRMFQMMTLFGCHERYFDREPLTKQDVLAILLILPVKDDQHVHKMYD